MIKITDREKDIPQGSFYVKFGQFYIYDDKKVVIEYLPELFKEKGNVFILSLKDVYYVFDFISNPPKVDIRDKQTGIDDYLFLYPFATVKEHTNIKKSKVKTKGVRLNKTTAAIFVLLLVAIISLLYVIKSRQHKQIANTPPPQPQAPQPAVATKPVCTENISSFMKHYVSYAGVEGSSIYVKIGDSKYSVQLNLKESENIIKEEDKIVVPYDAEKGYDNEGVVFRINDYYKCLSFIFDNIDKPLTIRRLNYEENSCDIVISYACINTNTN